jgi:sugar lactone lactonase YvrE
MGIKNRYFLNVGAVILLAGSGCGSGSSGDECLAASGTSCTWAGVAGTVGFNGDGLDRLDTWMYFPSDVTFAPDGSGWVADWNNHLVRRVKTDDTVDTVFGADYEGDGSPGETDRLPVGNPAGAPGIEVALNHPVEIKFFPDGRALLAAWHNNKVRVLDPVTGIATVVAGNTYGFFGDSGPAYDARFNLVPAVEIAPDNTIFVVDQRNERIRQISNDPTPMISTIAGTGTQGSTGDGGLAIEAELSFDKGNTPLPSGSLVLRGDELFIATSTSHNIRRINLTTKIIDCVAGCTATLGYTGDGGSAKTATFNFPNDLEFGPDGRLYVADLRNNVIRAIDLAADLIETVAGTGQICPLGSTCTEASEGLQALELQLNEPYGIAFDAAGHLYIADTLNSRIVRVAR